MMGGGGDGIYESVGRCNFLGGGEGALRRMKGRGRYFFVFLEIFGFDAVCTESLFEIYSQLFFFSLFFSSFLESVMHKF